MGGSCIPDHPEGHRGTAGGCQSPPQTRLDHLALAHPPDEVECGWQGLCWRAGGQGRMGWVRELLEVMWLVEGVGEG